jgi:hypothetical protein
VLNFSFVRRARVPAPAETQSNVCGAGLETLLEEGDGGEGEEGGEDEDVEFAVSVGEGGEVTVKTAAKASCSWRVRCSDNSVSGHWRRRRCKGRTVMLRHARARSCCPCADDTRRCCLRLRFLLGRITPFIY